MSFLSRFFSHKKSKSKGSSANYKKSSAETYKDERKLFLKKERAKEKSAASARTSYISELSLQGQPDKAIFAVSDNDFSKAFSGIILSDDLHYDNNIVISDDKDDRLLQLIRTSVGSDYLPDTIFSRGEFKYFKNRFLQHAGIAKTEASFCQMYTDWLFFCKDAGYDMDDYFDYEFYNKDFQTRFSFVSASFRENLRRKLNVNFNILAKKNLFLETFRDFIKRPWLDCNVCTLDEFKSFCRETPVFFSKSEQGFGGAGVRKLSLSESQAEEMYPQLQAQNCVVEAPVIQHSAISEFNSSTVNTIRVMTVADANDDIIISNAAIRFGRKDSFADNYHQGGVCASVDPTNGIINSDAIDITGAHFTCHPDSGKVFRGFEIPCWDVLRDTVTSAALSCKESVRIVGWDIAITSDGDIDFIEGNSRPGFDILQAPNMTGLKKLYLDITSGLVTEEELTDVSKGYWRKWPLPI